MSSPIKFILFTYNRPTNLTLSELTQSKNADRVSKNLNCKANMFQSKREYLGVFHFTTDCESDFDFVVKLESIIAFGEILKQQG